MTDGDKIKLRGVENIIKQKTIRSDYSSYLSLKFLTFLGTYIKGDLNLEYDLQIFMDSKTYSKTKIIRGTAVII